MVLRVNDTIPNFHRIEDLKHFLETTGCRRCELGSQEGLHGCCVARGTSKNKLMIVGEAPGKNEDLTKTPFSGPAGKKLDEIWASVGMSTKDWWLTNTINCRPIAPPGSGRENTPPTAAQKKACNVFLFDQIRLLQPRIIVPLGAVATASILGMSSIKMGDYRGRLFQKEFPANSGRECDIFPMYHPSYLIRNNGNKERYNSIRSIIWKDIQLLKSLVDRLDTV